MAVNTVFATKLALVPGAPSISYVTNDTGHDDFEFSFSHDGGSPGTYTVTGNSEYACELGAGQLLYRAGFMFCAPSTLYHKIPSSVPTNLTATREKLWMYGNTFAQTYGNSFPSPHSSSSSTLNNRTGLWSVLNGWRDNYSGGPALKNGHRWTSITRNGSSGPLRQFFVDNPQMLISGDLDSFDLPNLSPSDYDLLTTYCAAVLLNEGFNFVNTTNFDASDGDTNSSQSFFQFAMDVCDKCRAGTAAIPTYGLIAKTGIPNARLGVYSYAGHKNAPTYTIGDRLIVAVALGFAPASTFLPRIQQFGARGALVTTRDYQDTHTWSFGRPLVNGKVKNNYADTYDAYIQAGCVGTHSETSGNWLVNIVAFWQFTKKIRTGTGTYAEALDEVVDAIFSGDSAVADLYNYWGDPFESFHEFSLEQSMAYVDAMGEGFLADGTTKYKDLFKYLLIINFELLTIPDRLEDSNSLQNSASDTFPAAYSKMMAHVVAVRELDVFHSYAHLRTFGRAYIGNTSNSSEYRGYEYLRFETPKTGPTTAEQNANLSAYLERIRYENPAAYADGIASYPTWNPPSFYSSPYLPTAQDWTDAKAYLAATNLRADDVDPPDPADLVLLHNLPVPVTNWRNYTPASEFYVRNSATFYFVGPGTVTISGFITVPGEGDAESTEEPYDEETYYDGSQIHVIQINANVRVSWDTGKLFLKLFPDTNKERASAGEYFAYIPTACANQVRVKCSSGNLRLVDANGIQNFSVGAQGVSQTIGPGVVHLEDNNSTGLMALVNASPYVSSDVTSNLVSAVIATQDFPHLIRINKI